MCEALVMLSPLEESYFVVMSHGDRPCSCGIGDSSSDCTLSMGLLPWRPRPSEPHQQELLEQGPSEEQRPARGQRE
jgi:hypothetical protein